MYYLYNEQNILNILSRKRQTELCKYINVSSVVLGQNSINKGLDGVEFILLLISFCVSVSKTVSLEHILLNSHLYRSLKRKRKFHSCQL